MKVISVKCPACGADLDIEEGRKQAFCTYCGAKILLENENERVFRTIDEAGIKHAETERMVMLKKMELLEKQREDIKKSKAARTKICIIMGITGLVMTCLGYMLGSLTGNPDSGFYMISMVGFFPLAGSAYIWIYSKNAEEDVQVDLGDKAKVPSSISGYETKNYAAVEAILRGAGFSNIRCIPLGDLTMGLLKKPDMVESITINGKEVTSGGKKFPKDAQVIISYHSISGKG